ncbi:MAG: 4Fe-4S binding protein [Desulfobacter sp.]|nr:MAG: 4Fe-4S binding protein [Desulfobacter sp.]
MVERLRQISQHLFFVLLIYGQRLGIHLGSSLPCFACPYVQGCAGHCYLMAFQRPLVGWQTAFDRIFSPAVLDMLWPLGLFLLFFAPLSKLWCAWICPFCLFQDWLTWIRKKLGIRPMVMTRKQRGAIKPVKYVLLALMVIIPLSMANFGLHPDWVVPFCQICPGRVILPMFEGNFSHVHIDFTNAVTMGFTLTAMVLTGGFLAGIFFKERFFCMFCPMLALMHLFSKLSPVRFEKNVATCSGCGNCERICPVDIADTFLEKKQKNVMSQDCMGCMSCAESCPTDTTLTFKWLGFPLFTSSREYQTRKWSKKS